MALEYCMANTHQQNVTSVFLYKKTEKMDIEDRRS